MGDLQGPAARSMHAIATPLLSQHSGRANAECKERQEAMKYIAYLKHQNLYLGVRDDEMQSCDGESLQSILERKDNAFGMKEEDFIQLVSQLAASITQLRTLNLINTAMTPDKILAFIDTEYRLVYKLECLAIDTLKSFRVRKAATLLESNHSLASADLDMACRTLGYTLCQAAVGLEIFRSHQDRQDIGSREPTGSDAVIDRNDGAILSRWWTNDFPGTCFLSRQLSGELKELLAGLMEEGRDRHESLGDLVLWAEAIADRVPVHVYCPTTCQRYCFYMMQPVTLDDLKSKLLAATDADECNQLLLWRNYPLDTSSSSEADDMQCVITTRERPILLVYLVATSSGLQAPATLDLTPTLLLRVGDDHSLVEDAYWAILVAKWFSCIERHIHENGQKLQLHDQAALSVGVFCKRQTDADGIGPDSNYKHLIESGLDRHNRDSDGGRMTVHVRESTKTKAQFKQDIAMQNPSEDQLDFHRAARIDLERRVSEVRDLYEKSSSTLAQSSATLDQNIREALVELAHSNPRRTLLNDQISDTSLVISTERGIETTDSMFDTIKDTVY